MHNTCGETLIRPPKRIRSIKPGNFWGNSMPFKRLLKFREKNKPNDRPQAETLPQPTAAHSEPQTVATEEPAAADEAVITNAPAGSFFEKDNRAVRIHRLSQANALWAEHEKLRPTIPFLRYVFDTRLQAVEALLSITCIHQAEDTGHLICTEPIIMGCCRLIDGRYEVFLSGEQLNYKTWSEATEKFSLHLGQYRNQLRPETYERFKTQSQAGQVFFKKEYYEITLTDTHYYQIFEAASFTAAKNFLLRNENIVTDRNRYIHVETPRGTVYRDMNGIHE